MTVVELIRRRAHASPDAHALLAPARDPLSFANLLRQVESTVAALRAHGIRRSDRVAVVLPNGPDMATAFLATASAATSAPLNPSYGYNEFEFYLKDLDARALIIPAGAQTPARDAAVAAGVRIIEFTSLSDAGAFSLESPETSVPVARIDFAESSDVALVLHTSGTTSRPKQVPLTHANLCASAGHIATALELGARDRCLNVMPLFHIHGLIGALLSSLSVGGSVVCTSGPLIPEFFDWLAEFTPTWYSTVPTMHHAIALGARSRATPVRHTLRFARSSSSALPRQTLAAIESLFGIPVIEAYGMTEASHQMASNPLPPRVRKHGSVGIAAGPDIAIMNAHGDLLGADETGEVVIRGPNVTLGYASNPEANAAAFTNGWFRTGDQGMLDQDGYLFLNGRLKELINRGGEKISPLEIDEVLLDHPAIVQALAFAVPHPTLGEDVAAAVVLHPDQSVTEREIREFVAGRIAYFKVPRRIFVLDAIPKGATGKPQRIGLHTRLGVASLEPEKAEASDESGESGPVHEIVGALWTELLGAPPATMRTSFFDAGGDSLLATQLVLGITRTLAVEMSLLEFFDGPTVAGVVRVVAPRLATSSALTAPAWTPAK